MNELQAVIRFGLDIALAIACAFSMLYLLGTALALILRRQTPDAAPAENGPLPRVTVQIPTFNEPAALQCAARCLAFDYPAEKLQILIGDDSSDPAVSGRIDAFAAAHPRITVCRRGGNAGYKPGNLNHMLAQTDGDYILVLDSDFLPGPGFLRRLIRPVIEHPDLAGVQAAWQISNARQNITTLMGAGIVNIIHIVILPLIKHFTANSVFCGSGELVRRDLLEQTGGWTPGALTEDVDYALRLIAEGHRIAYLENLKVACETPHRPRDLFRQQMRWAYGVMRAFINNGLRLFRSRLIRWQTKAAAICFGGGYLMVTALLFALILGLVSVSVGWFAPETAGNTWTAVERTAGTLRNILFTCGMLVSSLCASFVAGAGFRHLGKLIAASLSLGFVLLFFVGNGLFRALFGLPMQWFMVRKNGNAAA